MAQAEIVAIRAGQEAVAVGRDGARPPLVEDHLDLVEAELDPIAVPDLLGRAFADRVGRLVDERAVGAEILECPIAVLVDQPAMALRQVALGIGHHPVAVAPPSDGELSTMDLASFWSHVVGATDRNEHEGHVRARSFGGR